MRSRCGSVASASAEALAKEGLVMLRRRTVTALCAALFLSLILPTAALAQEEPEVISDVTIVSAVVDMKTGVPTVTVSVTCLMDVGYQVRGEAELTQTYGPGRLASSWQGGFGGSPCQAGQVLSFPIRFGHQQGRFVPGPAEIHGFMEAFLESGTSIADDMEGIGPATVTLRPA
jgi:hypothetical protein